MNTDTNHIPDDRFSKEIVHLSSERIRKRIVVLSALLAAAVFTLDSFIPLGVAAGVPYVALVLMGFKFPKPQHSYVLAIIGSILTLAGYVLSPDAGIHWVVLSNRALALFAIWITAILIASRMEFEHKLLVTHNKLQEEVDKHAQDLKKGERIRQAMEESEETLLEIIQNSPIAIGITDESGKPVYWNPLFRRIGVRQNEEAENTGFQLSFANPNTPKLFHERFMKGEAVREEEVELITAEGNSAWVEITIQNLVFEGQRSILTWLYDITDHKNQERVIIEERQEAERANMAKSQFLANMSHEIRTPMNGILGMAEMLDNSMLATEQKSMISIIHESATGLLGIINNILDFSKIEAEKLEIENIDLSICHITESLTEIIAHRAAEKGVALYTYVDPTIPGRLLGDPIRLRQVLTNLGDNALKFTEQGEINITIKPERMSSQEITLIFSVTDSGIGVPKEKQSALFLPFEQADGTTVRRFGGTGLGLSISRALVEMMGGEIGIESEPDHGSTFWFRLKFPIVQERRKSWHDRLKGTDVLVVSPNGTLTDILRSYLTYAGVETAFTKDCAAALLEFNRAPSALQSWDVVLIDGDLPVPSINDLITTAHDSFDAKTVILTSLPYISTDFMETFPKVFSFIAKPVARTILMKNIAAAAGHMDLGAQNSHGRRNDDDKGGKITYTPPSIDEALNKKALLLVAEDNKTNQAVISMVLKKLGYAAEFCDDGKQAVERLQERDYGLLLTDCHMPEMNGYQLTAWVREREKTGQYPRLPIIALTADAIIGTEERCLKAGMDDYLVKPINSGKLDAAILALLPVAGEIRIQESATHPVTPSERSETKVISTPVLDLNYLRDVFEDDDLLPDLLQEYIDSTEPLIKNTQEFTKNGDYEAARETAHAAKGASRMAGAILVGDLCEKIQMALTEDNVDEAKKHCLQLTPAFEELRARIDEIVNKL